MSANATLIDENNDSFILTQSVKSQATPIFSLDTFLQKHLRFTKKRIKYQREELLNFCLQAEFEFRKMTSALVEIPYIPIYIIGDIHGQWRDLLRMFSVLGAPGKVRYLFLGDYVDRGKRSLECISLLVALKLKYPTMIYLIRGNHECDYINYNYGFFEEIQSRFNLGDSVEIFKAFNSLFNYLPLAALVVKRILCMHGGISPNLNSMNVLRRITLPTKVAHDDKLTLDLLWADPKADTRNFIFNDTRDCSWFFGADTVVKLCEKLQLDLIVRGHQALKNGFGFFGKCHMATVFSAPRYLMPESSNFGAVIKINKEYELSVIIFNPVTKETLGKFKEIFDENLANDKDADEVTKIEKMPEFIMTASQWGTIPMKEGNIK